jgi:O-antigen/teichoic acid export membrane protein
VSASSSWHAREQGLLPFVRNVSTRYAAIVAEAVLGLIVLPYNVAHLGKEAYGLWMLTTSVTAYFTVLQLGYGGALVKFVAEYRAKKDAGALNEILSTMFFVYAAIGVACYAAAAVVSLFLPHIFNLAPGQSHTGQILLLITAAQVALYLPFSVFGGVINGFERYYVNNVVGTVSNSIAALANVIVLWLGYGLVEVVATTTTIRVLPFLVYRLNAYWAFPELHLSPRLFRRDRLRELTGFSAYLAVIDWSTRICYATDAFVIGMFLNTAAVGVYAVGQRLTDALFKVTNQLHILLFPAVVHSAVVGNTDNQRDLMTKGTRFQLAIAMALCSATIADADALIAAMFPGQRLDVSVVIVQQLAGVVVLRAWCCAHGWRCRARCSRVPITTATSR